MDSGTGCDRLDTFFIKTLLLLAFDLNQYLPGLLINKKGFGLPPLFLRGIISVIGTLEYVLWSKIRNLVACTLRIGRTVLSFKSQFCLNIYPVCVLKATETKFGF